MAVDPVEAKRRKLEEAARKKREASDKPLSNTLANTRAEPPQPEQVDKERLALEVERARLEMQRAQLERDRAALVAEAARAASAPAPVAAPKSRFSPKAPAKKRSLFETLFTCAAVAAGAFMLAVGIVVVMLVIGPPKSAGKRTPVPTAPADAMWDGTGPPTGEEKARQMEAAQMWRNVLEAGRAVDATRSPDAEEFIRSRTSEIYGEALNREIAKGNIWDHELGPRLEYEAREAAVKEWEQAKRLSDAIDRDNGDAPPRTRRTGTVGG